MEKLVETRIANDPKLLELAHPKLVEKLEKSNELINKLQKDVEVPL